MTTAWDAPLVPDPSPWGRVLETTSAVRWPLPWHLIRSLHNADTIPEDKLAILAYGLSVDLWNPAWSIEKRRAVVRQALVNHALKGTIEGVRRYLAIVDAELVQYLAPPQRAFAAGSPTKDEIDAWLAIMPQLRIYLRADPGEDEGGAFADRDFVEVDLPATAFAGFDTAEARYGRHAVIWDQGVETELRTVDVLTAEESRPAVEFERVSLPGVGGWSFADADFVETAWYDATVTEAQLVSYKLDQSYIHRESTLALQTLVPGLDPIDVRFERVSEIGDGDSAGFVSADGFDSAFYLRDDLAPWMLYDRIFLHDPERAIPLVDAYSFLDHTRLGIGDFSFELMVKSEAVREPPICFTEEYLDSPVYIADEDLTHVYDALDAVAMSKAFRDKALVTFETTRPRFWGDGIPLDGTVRLWSRVPAGL